MISINILAPKSEIRTSLKSYMDIKNDQPVIFKKTAKKFFAENGIELQDAPMVIVKNNIYWMLKHTMYKGYKGKRIEDASYLPIVDVQE